MGRPKKPTRLKVLAGNPGGRPLPPPAPEPLLPGNIEPPADLTGYGVEVWRNLAPKLRDLGLLTELDVGLLRDYCRLGAEQRLLEDVLDAEGRTIASPQGLRARPEVAILAQVRAQKLRLSDLLGLSPRARASLGVSAKPAKKTFEQWAKKA